MTLTRHVGLPPGPPPKRRTPLKARRKDPVSRKTRQAMWDRSGGRCEIGITEACQARGRRLIAGLWQYSHRVRVAVSPTHGPAGGLAGCPECHGWWEALQVSVGDDSRRRVAEDCGWLIRAETLEARNPASVKAWIDGRWVRLTEAGPYEEVA
jgi:hypothetical protein